MSNINTYLLALMPHSSLCEKIFLERKAMAVKYGLKNLIAVQYPVVIASFTQYELREPKWISELKKIAASTVPFKVEMRNYDSLPTHTIFIRIASKLPVQGLLREIKKHTQALMKLDESHKPYFISEPKINMATKLLPYQYEKAWKEYKYKDFSERFIAGELYVMRKTKADNFYKLAQRIEFKPNSKESIQPSLFTSLK